MVDSFVTNDKSQAVADTACKSCGPLSLSNGKYPKRHACDCLPTLEYLRFELIIRFNSINRPTDATCDRLYFLSMCLLYMFRASGAHHQESPNRTYSVQFPVFVSVCGTVL
jgi:hypothetical protein